MKSIFNTIIFSSFALPFILPLTLLPALLSMPGNVYGQRIIQPSNGLPQARPVPERHIQSSPGVVHIGDDIAEGVNSANRNADTLVLCPDYFKRVLQPWVEHRKRQGHQVVVQAPMASAYGIKQQIQTLARHGNLKSVVLIGDTPTSDPRSYQKAVPTDYVPAKVIAKFGPEPEIATDNTYADIDGDGLPDLAIGRIAVDSQRGLERQIRKIINYEAASGGQWQRQINLVAGTGGFGQLSDSVIEQTSRRLISDLIPPEYSTSMTYANWSSAYCPDPRQFIPVTLERLNEGSLFWVYMGHGHPHRLDYVRTPIGGFPMFRDRDIAQLDCKKGQPIALMLACYTGAFDFPKDCLAEKMVNEPGGPIAAICGSRVTMPAGMSLLSVGLIEEYFNGDKETLGEMFMAAKRKLVVADSDAEPTVDSPATIPLAMPVEAEQSESRYRETIEMLGKTLSPSGNNLNAEAQEHIHLFHLLGDPLLRVKRPQQIELAIDPSDDPSRLKVKGYSPHPGSMMVELVYCRDRFQKRPPRRPEFKWDEESLASYGEVYEQSNCRTVSAKQIVVPAGEFEFELQVPDWAKGRCVVRGYLQQPGQKRYALGAEELNIKRR